MRRSWETGRFWFNFAPLPAGFMKRVLHDGGDPAELPDVEVRAEMDAVVEKMTELRYYREGCAVHFPVEKTKERDWPTKYSGRFRGFIGSGMHQRSCPVGA